MRVDRNIFFKQSSLIETYFLLRTFYCCRPEGVSRRCSIKKVFLKISQNSQENTCVRVSFLIKVQAEAWNFIKTNTLAQVFSCEILKNTFFHRTPPVAASGPLSSSNLKLVEGASSLKQHILITATTKCA